MRLTQEGGELWGEPSITTIKYYHGNIYIKCRLGDVISFLPFPPFRRGKTSENDERDGIQREQNHSSRLILFRMEMLNFAYIN